MTFAFSERKGVSYRRAREIDLFKPAAYLAKFSDGSYTRAVNSADDELSC